MQSTVSPDLHPLAGGSVGTLQIEQATHFLGLPNDLIEGERAWLNHVVHNVGAVLAYPQTPSPANAAWAAANRASGTRNGLHDT